MDYILKAENLTKIYGHHKALDNFSMHIPQGAIYGLVGRNGAGKTTLLRIICGLQEATFGDYSLYGISSRKHEILNARKEMGAVIETPAIYLDMSATGNLKEQYRVLGLRSFDTIPQLLKMVGLEDTGRKKAKNFSLGMRQRLGIAIALVGNPSFLVLDEPTAGLDPKERINIRNFVSELSRECVVIFATHVVSDVECIAKEMILIKRGEIVRQDEIPKLIAEMDGLVWEFVAQENEVMSIQKEYLVSNLSVGKEGIIVRAVGTDEEIKREKHAVRAGMEEVYLYHMTSEAKREKDK